MKCPACSIPDRVEILESRLSADELRVRRRRACAACGHRWTTIEAEVDMVTGKVKWAGANATGSVRSSAARSTGSGRVVKPPATRSANPPPVVAGGVGGGLPSALGLVSGSDPARRSGSGSVAPARETIYPAEFEAAWAATAKTGSKFKALAAWKRHGKPNASAIATAWAAWSRLVRWQEGFVPHVVTWLNGRCWEQEPVEVVRTAVPEKAARSRDAWREVLNERKATG